MITALARLALLLALTFTFTGCTGKTEPKTQDPAEVEKIREKHVNEAQRERENK